MNSELNDDVLLLNNMCKRMFSKLPKIDSSKDYWFIRANRGSTILVS